jgi:hypothetical protein
MRIDSIRAFLVAILAALLMALAQPALAQGAADYQAKLQQYLQAHDAYEVEAERYWNAVIAKRKIRNAKRRDHTPIVLADYVLTQPPVYSGPPRPVNPEGPGPLPGEHERVPIPVIADFLKAAAEQFNFVPDRPSEFEFKRGYAKAALAGGLTREQAVGVYAFETGGNGNYDTQAGVSVTRPNAISPAIGYNQLLSTNSVSLLADHGNRILAALRAKAKLLSGAAKQNMDRKIEGLKRMIAYSQTVPHSWSAFDQLAKTTPGGWGIHAAVLDIDIGPLLQVEKLMDSVRFARAKHYERPLTAAEVELMNLTGDGNGFDMVTMPAEFRAKVPTTNFFQQNGYARNPVARRTGVVAGLIAEIQGHIDRAEKSQGARDMMAAF